MLRSCTCGILAHVLDPKVPFVWIRNHLPSEAVKWWNTKTRLSEAGGYFDADVRSMVFDLQLPTVRFLELLPEFEPHGIDLLQMARRVPNTLTLDGVPKSEVNQVLIKNGLHLKFFLPHAIEWASLASPDLKVLEEALKHPEIGRLAFKAD